MITLLHLVLLDPDQASTALHVLAYLMLSLGLGLPLRRGPAEGAAFGFMLLGGGCDLALFSLRALAAPVGLFGPVALALAIGEMLVLRRFVLAEANPRPPVGWGEGVMLAVFFGGLWVVRIIQVDPSSSLSSHLGWVSLYAGESFRAGRFLQPGELAAGHGVLESVAYVADASGLVDLSAWTGVTRLYPAHLATSILAAGLAVVVLLRALAPSRAAMAAFLALSALLVGVDPLFRDAVARHWGDTYLLLGGAVVLAVLVRAGEVRDKALAAAAAAAFMVFSRHYAALYWAGLTGIGFLAATWSRRRLELVPWMVLTALFLVNAAREIWCLVAQPSPWYPGSRQVAEATFGVSGWTSGVLHDLGVLSQWHFSLPLALVQTLYLTVPLAVAVLVPEMRRRPAWLLPLAVFSAPFAMQALTGYRTSVEINKLMIVVVFVYAWYPAYLLGRVAAIRGWAPPALRRERQVAVATLAAVALALAIGGSAAAREVAWGFGLYRQHNVDRGMAIALAEAEGPRLADIAAAPLVYVYFEPGLALRSYIGGDVYRDLDWYGNTVERQMPAARDLGDLVARLGYPNLWLSAPSIYTDAVRPAGLRFTEELAHVEGQPWVERVVRYGRARFVIVRKPR